MERLVRLFVLEYGEKPSGTVPLTGSASPRCYYRMTSGTASCIGVIGTDRQENDAFVALARHFADRGINVPEVFAVSDDGMAYIQEDLGDDILFDRFAQENRSGEVSAQMEDLLLDTVRLIPKIQFEGARDLDFSVCHPQEKFTARSAMFDLNYFKYCFLKPVGLEFHEMLLQDDFERFAEDLAMCGLPSADAEDVPVILLRDCQSRNVMIKGGQPYFIDFQSGRRGPIYYDVASFIWHARAGYSQELKTKMLEAYLEALSSYIKVDRRKFMEDLRLFRLFRCLQVLGAYGFRGWSEKKANFVVSIPAAVQTLTGLLDQPFERYPYMNQVLNELVRHPRLSPETADGRLEVRVYSFSFKKGIPEDPSGNGGGYVFDCRSIHNPGRYEPYKKLTGRDESVIRFLEDDGEITVFLEHVYGVVGPHVRNYRDRGFQQLMVSFGCTGGQHRSVYSAEHMARRIAEDFPDVCVRLIHREQNIDEYIREGNV